MSKIRVIKLLENEYMLETNVGGHTFHSGVRSKNTMRRWLKKWKVPLDINRVFYIEGGDF